MKEVLTGSVDARLLSEGEVSYVRWIFNIAFLDSSRWALLSRSSASAIVLWNLFHNSLFPQIRAASLSSSSKTKSRLSSRAIFTCTVPTSEKIRRFCRVLRLTALTCRVANLSSFPRPPALRLGCCRLVNRYIPHRRSSVLLRGLPEEVRRVAVESRKSDGSQLYETVTAYKSATLQNCEVSTRLLSGQKPLRLREEPFDLGECFFFVSSNSTWSLTSPPQRIVAVGSMDAPSGWLARGLARQRRN